MKFIIFLSGVLDVGNLILRFEILDFAKILNDEDKLTLSQVLEPHLDDNDELIMLHKYLQDDYSAIVYLDKFNKRLEKVI